MMIIIDVIGGLNDSMLAPRLKELMGVSITLW